MEKKVKGYTIRPASETPFAAIANFLSRLRIILGGDRFEGLYSAVSKTIVEVKSSASVLDYGCGTMEVSRRLLSDGLIKSFGGMDIFPKPQDGDPSIWAMYTQVAVGRDLSRETHYDIAIVLDVLHHVAEVDRRQLLSSLAGICDYIIVKDHFEYGYASRHLLRLADLYGNFAFGVNIPDRYFNKERWHQLVTSAGLRELNCKVGVKIHKGLFSLLLPSRFHFISVLTKN